MSCRASPFLLLTIESSDPHHICSDLLNGVRAAHLHGVGQLTGQLVDVALDAFLAAIKSREVKKTYLCVTFGRPTPPDATLGGYLLKDADRGIVKIVEDKQPGAKDVETQYETIAVSGRLALLKVRLITGRTHQIRAHMASIGCPILGDSKYGNNTANRELKLKYQALCAWELTMPHFNQPDFEFLSGKTFHAPKPWYYQQVLDGTLK